MNRKNIRRGEIYYADLDPVVGSEQGKRRPVLIVQNDLGNKHSPTTVIVPITCRSKKNDLPTHVTIPQLVGLVADSLALVEHIRTIDQTRLREYLGRISDKVQDAIDKALVVSVGLDKETVKKAEILTLCLCPRCKSDFQDSGCILIKRGWQKDKKICDFCERRLGLEFGIFNTNNLSTPP